MYRRVHQLTLEQKQVYYVYLNIGIPLYHYYKLKQPPIDQGSISPNTTLSVNCICYGIFHLNESIFSTLF